MSNLQSIVGSWTGTYRLWLEPEVLRSESVTTSQIVSVAGDRFVRIDYDWLDGDEPHQGSMFYGLNNDDVAQLAWVDSFHTDGSIMFGTGTGEGGVLFTYGPTDEPWGWRTTVEQPTTDHLVITSWNVTPGGDEARATEATYRRLA